MCGKRLKVFLLLLVFSFSVCFAESYLITDEQLNEIQEQTQIIKALVQPFITEYYGNGVNHQLGIPLPTVTTKERFAICGTTDGIELGFRMLQPNELSAATGFPEDYKFKGTKVEIVKQIGNAVPPNFAKAIFGQALKEMTA